MTATHTLLRRLGLAALLFFLVAVLAVLWHNWGDLLGPAPAPAPAVTQAQRAHGAVLARAGNCVACHTARGGAPLAGGRPIETPFGIVYSSNLTPDRETGLGLWDARDFWRALHRGRSRDGRLLSPAFPYEHTSLITREDSDALFAWLQSQSAVHQATPAHQLRWPLGTQAALAVWRTLYFEPRPFVPDPQRDAQDNRGAYLVQGLGHCAACHAPRNALGASAGVDVLSGAHMPMGPWYAPNLLDERETGLARQPLSDIVRLLRTGHSPHSSVSGPMAEVVQQGLQHLPEADLLAIAQHLQRRAREAAPSHPPAVVPAVVPARAAVAELGRGLYERHCADCHGAQGQGVPGIYPALSGNRAVRLDSPTNLVQMVLHGGFGVSTQDHPRPFGMPPFVLTLSDREIAAVLTHLRQGLQAPEAQATEVTPLQVHRIRSASAP